MIKFNELKKYIDEIIAKLNEIKEKMSKYSKIDTDYRAGALIEEINKKIAQIKSVYTNVYASADFRDQYGENSNYDYTNYIKMLRDQVIEYEKIYKKIIKFESVFGYYN